MRKRPWQVENAQSKKSSGKNVNKKIVGCFSSFEVSPCDLIKTIASNKAVFSFPDLKCKENCNLAVKKLNKVLNRPILK